jgi:hypothetical protein
LFDHARSKRANAVDDSQKIHVDQPLPCAHGVFPHRRRTTDNTRIVTHEINPTEAFEANIGERLHIDGISNVRRDGKDSGAPFDQALTRSIYQRTSDIRDDQRKSSPAQCLGQPVANPASGSSNHRNLA